MELGRPVERFSVNTIVKIGAVARPVSGVKKTLFFISTGDRRQTACRVFCAFGDDIDDAIDRVRPPDSSTGPTNNLNAVDILKYRVLHLPVCAGKQWGVQTSSIHQNQHGTRKPGFEAAN